jgi:predicted nucleic acid-binding protein
MSPGFSRLFVLPRTAQASWPNLLTLCLAIPVGGKQIHDANIVATMQTYGIDKLLTHNTVDFARYQSLITVIPLV